jgi:hypothetical protein
MASSHAAEGELVDLQNRWMQAWQDRDRPTLEAILAPEFTLTSARTDRLMPRDAWLDAAMTRTANESFRYDDFRIEIFTDAAVVKSRLTQRATVDGQDWSGTFQVTDVWIRRDARWQVVARHSSTPPQTEF